MTFILLCVIAFCSYGAVFSTSLDITDSECEPPDYPKWGGYGPRREFYLPGDQIHYFCETETYIGGNYLRICEDTGDWSGDAPVCDYPAEIASKNQSSTEYHPEENSAERASDGDRSTCSLTRSEQGAYWMGTLKTPGEVIRVMIFSPRVEVDYEVFMIKRDGSKLSCGRRQGRVDRLNWNFHNCPGPNNRDGVAIKIETRSNKPLELCEVVVHTLTDPTCTDPHVRIDRGRLELTRKKASLICDPGFTMGSYSRLDCIRTGQWNRRNLVCLERD